MAKPRKPLSLNDLQRAMVAGMTIAMVSGASLAAEWTTSKEIALGGVYTDNLFLTDADEETAWVNLVSPAISILGKGRDLGLGLVFAPQYVNYVSSEADDKFYTRLQADAKAEIVQDRFFIDARATAGQGQINVLGPSGGDVVNATDNVQTIYNYAIAPTYRNRFGKYADLKAQYENSGVFYSDEGDDSVANILELELRSGPVFERTLWGAILHNEHVRYDRSSSNRLTDSNKRLTNVGAFGGYELNRRWRADAVAGYEDNDIDSSQPDTSGVRWEISGTWTPNVRTELELGIGRRFFGWTPLLVFSHRSKRSLWTASYKRDLSSAATERSAVNVFELENAQGEPNLDPITGEPAGIPPGEAPPSSSSFVSNTFRTDYALETRRSKLGANAAYILRQYEDSSQDYSSAWARVFWDRHLSPVTSANLSLGWYWAKNEGNPESAANTEYTDWTLTLGITQKLTQRTDVGAWYSFRKRESDQRDDQYQENRVSVAIRTVWAD